MKHFSYILVFLFLISCTSNTIYKKPKGLIPKDSMVALLTDMYIASSAKNQKNKFLKKEKNYTILVYEKYKIDSTRFDVSNMYYTSKIEEYSEMLAKVKINLDSLEKLYRDKQIIKDSLNKGKKKKMTKEDILLPEEELKLEEIPRELMKKNSKLMKKKKLKDLKQI